ncbi:MAG: DUF4827 domain-containing protein [Mediterranea sp.]|jgi:hypothetical protein|nr:DUF4827 domain-containing protein [Mediterranea sp.]
MKKLLFLFLTLLAAGSIFQACDNTKTYAEMLDDEKDAVNQFIKDSAIHVISQAEFERDTVTDVSKNQYVSFSSNGVYMQIVDRGSEPDEMTNLVDTFASGDLICVRYVEKNIATRELTCFDVPLPDYMSATQYYSTPGTFRYSVNSTYASGIFIEMDYLWSYTYNNTAVPQGWLAVLPYLRNGAHVKLIIPSKVGHNTAQQNVTPYFYDIWKMSKAKS